MKSRRVDWTWHLRVSHIFHVLLKISPQGEEGTARESIHKKPHQCLHEVTSEKLLFYKSEQISLLLIWKRGKFSITLPIFWRFDGFTHLRVWKQALPSHKITSIPPTPNPEALKGTAAAEFTEHQKSTGISLANNNKIQNKATNINSTWIASPLLREQVICSLVLLTFLNKKSWRDADTRNQSCCHLIIWAQEP